MYNEIMVRLVKDAIKGQHAALHDLTVETLIKSLSVMTSLHQVGIHCAGNIYFAKHKYRSNRHWCILSIQFTNCVH